jgi:micrococcal nuclease
MNRLDRYGRRFLAGAAVAGLLIAGTAALQAGSERVVLGPIWDGDTFRATWGGQPERRVRVAGLDAPDIGQHADCEREHDLGMAATERAVELLRAAPDVWLSEIDYTADPWGRPVARVWLGLPHVAPELAAVLIAEGLGRPWGGRKSDWCGDGD